MDRNERLARLKNYGTRYELAVWKGDERYLVVYSHGKSRNSIFQAVAEKGELMVALTGDKEIHFAKKVKDGAKMGDWTINFTGRSQRECIAEDKELKFIGDLELATASNA